MSARPDWPVAVRSVDVAEGVPALTDVADYPRTRVFVSDGGVLIGCVDIPNGRRAIPADRLRCEIGRTLANALLRRSLERELGAGAAPVLDSRVPVSIVIPTCGRADDLRRCLAALGARTSARRIEILIVDNRPGQGTTADVVREYPRVRMIAEPKPGLSYARNAGFAAATGDILIAIDDDVTVPPGWLERLVAPFARPEVACVTGHVLPASLDTRAEFWFEAYGGLGRGFTPLDAGGPWFHGRRAAVPTWELGATANAAFRASIFRDPRVGMLDEALGAGTPTGCSEDTYLFYRILKAGYTIAYEPSAWVWHRHRTDARALRQQIRAYSTGHVAYQLLTLVRERDSRALVRLGWSLPKTYARRAFERLRGRSDYPVRLILTEIAGNLRGPFALWRSIRRARRLGPGARCAGPVCAAIPGGPAGGIEVAATPRRAGQGTG